MDFMAIHINVADEIIKICDECDSDYYANHSKMESLCPNCAHYIYSYKIIRIKWKIINVKYVVGIVRFHLSLQN